MKDVVIIGGSYAGLSAALALGRSMRDVVIIDSGNPCNKTSRTAHNLLSRDGANPASLLETSRAEVLQYPGVHFLQDEVTDLERNGRDFGITTAGGRRFLARKIIFATGLLDEMPDIPGFRDCWGITVLHCPYCHGFEKQGRKTGIIASGNTAFEFAEQIGHWTKDLYVLTNGETRMDYDQLRVLADKQIQVIDKEINHLEHHEGIISAVCFTDDSRFELEAAYARPFMKQQSDLPEKCGCEFHSIHIQVDQYQQTSVHGIFAAGDNCSPLRSLSNAIAAGSIAGAYINKELIHETFLNSPAAARVAQ